MRYFVKRIHAPYTIMIIPVAALICMLLLLDYFRFKSSFTVLVIGIPATIFLAYFINKYFKSWGLYIIEKDIYYKNTFMKRIAADEIFAIKIARSALKINNSIVDLIDREGNSLYSMILVKQYNPWDRVEQEMNDYRFCLKFREFVICRVVLNLEVIDYLKALNPRIIIFPAVLSNGEIIGT